MDQATRCRTVVILLDGGTACLLDGVDPRAFARLQVQESGQPIRHVSKTLVRRLVCSHQRHPAVHRGNCVRDRIRGGVEIPDVGSGLIPGLAPSGGEIRAVQADWANGGA